MSQEGGAAAWPIALLVERVEESDDEVDEDSQVEGDGAPERHVGADPAEERLGWNQRRIHQIFWKPTF